MPEAPRRGGQLQHVSDKDPEGAPGLQARSEAVPLRSQLSRLPGGPRASVDADTMP